MKFQACLLLMFSVVFCHCYTALQQFQPAYKQNNSVFNGKIRGDLFFQVAGFSEQEKPQIDFVFFRKIEQREILYNTLALTSIKGVTDSLISKEILGLLEEEVLYSCNKQGRGIQILSRKNALKSLGAFIVQVIFPSFQSDQYRIGQTFNKSLSVSVQISSQPYLIQGDVKYQIMKILQGTASTLITISADISLSIQQDNPARKIGYVTGQQTILFDSQLGDILENEIDVKLQIETAIKAGYFQAPITTRGELQIDIQRSTD